MYLSLQTLMDCAHLRVLAGGGDVLRLLQIHRVALTPSQVVQHHVMGDGEYPCRGFRIAAEPAGAFPDLDHYIIDQLLDGARFIDQPVQEAEQATLVNGIELLERLAVPRRDAMNPERLVLHLQRHPVSGTNHSARLVTIRKEKV